MSTNSTNDSNLVFSYLEHRIIIGVLGMGLAPIVAAGHWIMTQEGLRRSVSSYYHTGMRNWLVGTLFVIGFFLLSYRGHDPIDNRVGNLAWFFALGVALFPTKPDVAVTDQDLTIWYIHLGFML
ncbi:MAG: hypothetical protein N2F24_02290 [Deltaproteobacteria bacterium]